MDSHEKKSRADAAQDAEATQFLTLESIQNETTGARRRGLLLAVALGVVVGLALLIAVAYAHRGNAARARVEARP